MAEVSRPERSPIIGRTTFALKGQEDQIPQVKVDIKSGKVIAVNSRRGDANVHISFERHEGSAAIETTIPKTGTKTTAHSSMGGINNNPRLYADSLVRMAGDVMIAYIKETSPNVRGGLIKAHTALLEELLLVIEKR